MQHASEASTTVAKRQQVFAWLALVALVSLQLANVVHQSGHAATELAETCVACVQLDSPALAASATGSSMPELAPETDRAQFIQAPARQATYTRPPPRAPPFA